VRQGCGVGDQEAVELTVDSKRWQWVLGCLGAEEPAFSQGALFDFRMRLLSTGMDQRLLERTVELARGRGGFDAKTLRLALDSSPLWARGQVTPITLGKNGLFSGTSLRSLRATQSVYLAQDRGPNLAHSPAGRPLATPPGAAHHRGRSRRPARTGRGRARFGPCQPTAGE